jgi:methyltransferase (TIGR00027 family)
MHENKPSGLAGVAAYLRCVEQLQPEGRRILNDPYSWHFLSGRLLRLAGKSRLLARFVHWSRPGRVEHIAARARFADELIRSRAAVPNLQVVMLGAGYDTAPYRLSAEVPQARFFEVDHPATQKAKRARLSELVLPGAERVRFVPVNLERHPLRPALAAAGFDTEAPAVVIWMGVSMFLTEPAIRGTLATLAEVMSDGSWLGFDYFTAAHARMTDDSNPRDLRRDRRLADRFGEPVLFGIDPKRLRSFFQEFGFSLVENVTGDDLTRRYTGDRRRSVDFWYVASAQRLR